MLSPNKKAWLQRKAERAKKRYEENKELERIGMAKTVHVDVKVSSLELVKMLLESVRDANDLCSLRDKHGKFTTADLDLVRKTVVKRAKKHLRNEKKEVPTSPMNMKFWADILDPTNCYDHTYLACVDDNTDCK